MTRITQYRREKPASGHRGINTNKSPRVAVAFEEPMFARLQALAADRQISFGEAVRHYVALGLKTRAIPSHTEGAEQ